MMDLHHWIDGHFVPASEGGWIPVTEPATGKTFARCACGTASDIDRAVQAAPAPLFPHGPKPRRPNACRFWSVLQAADR